MPLTLLRCHRSDRPYNATQSLLEAVDGFYVFLLNNIMQNAQLREELMEVKLNIRCSREDKEQIRKYAMSRGRTSASIVREVLAEKGIITL